MMERRIKNRDLWDLRAQQFPHGPNSTKVRRVMQGSEVNATFDSRHHFVGDQNRFSKRLAAMHHSMTDRVNVGGALNFRDAGIGRGCPVNDEIERAGNVLQGRCELLLRAVALLYGDNGFGADSLDLASQKADVFILANSVEIRGDDLEFQAGAAGVEDENVH